MGYLSPKELTQAYAAAGEAKTKKSALELFVLAIMAGAMIALGCAATNTAAHGISDVGLMRTVLGLLFPVGLCMVIVTGAELFTGNSLIVISALDRRCSVAAMLRNWCIVYLGNLVGSALVAAACAFFGQLDYSKGQLAVFTIKLAIGKCSLPFMNGVVLGVFCNVLVCMGVLMAMAAKDAAGRLIGAYMPVVFFVVCGFEHCVANMYYILAGIFAAMDPAYSALAVQAGLDLSKLTLFNFLFANLLPVTIGNVIGGGLLGAGMWLCYLRRKG